MKAGRIHHFGPPNAIVIDEITRPTPQEGELVVGVVAAGVGPWDALIREGKSVVQLPFPIILGSDLAGVVDSVGTGVTQFKPGDEVFSVVVAVTAYQMLFDYAQLKAGQAVLIHGAGGNVGAYAVQLAKQAKLKVYATRWVR